MPEDSRITSVEELEALYGPAVPRSLKKELDHLSDQYRAFVDAAPFVVVATSGPEGLDCSPRGDPPGFVRVHDPRTVMMPDRRGNNRLDKLKNIVRNHRLSLLFLKPCVGETVSINGKEEITPERELGATFALQGKKPKAVNNDQNDKT